MNPVTIIYKFWCKFECFYILKKKKISINHYSQSMKLNLCSNLHIHYKNSIKTFNSFPQHLTFSQSRNYFSSWEQTIANIHMATSTWIWFQNFLTFLSTFYYLACALFLRECYNLKIVHQQCFFTGLENNLWNSSTC